MNIGWHRFLLTHSCFAHFQVEPTSIAAEDGRIREGDQIIQVNTVSLNFKYRIGGRVMHSILSVCLFVCLCHAYH